MAEGRMKEISGQSVHIVSINGDRPGVMKTIESGGGAPAYKGETVFTPSASTQIVEVNGYVMRDNITIEPIPSNYGRLIWNGSTLTVY